MSTKRTLCCLFACLILLPLFIPLCAFATQRPTNQSLITYIDGTHAKYNANSPRGSSIEYILDEVPTDLYSGGSHLCIPCAITNVAAYWSVNGYSGFGCSTASQRETKAALVQTTMDLDGGSHSSNAYIQQGFDCLSFTSGSYTVSLQSTAYWSGAFDYSDILNQILDGCPVMLGFAPVSGNPYTNSSGTPVGHMTVCAGILSDGSSNYVYVSDAHVNYLRLLPFDYNVNDFIATVFVLYTTTLSGG